MAVVDARCALCGEVVEVELPFEDGEACANPCCEGVLRRVWAVNLNPVPGGGGSPGRFGGSKRG
jgi:hypothetical protein